MSSLETRVLVSARRFADLNVVDADLPTPEPANPRLSSITAPELVLSELGRSDADEHVVLFDGLAERDERALRAERAAAADEEVTKDASAG